MGSFVLDEDLARALAKQLLESADLMAESKKASRRGCQAAKMSGMTGVRQRILNRSRKWPE
jgi:hypothetical protein